jgi:AcrR family transcriptional regulator
MVKKTRKRTRAPAPASRGSYALLWEPPRRGARGPARTLDIDSIVEGAIALADREGLDALTMARLASRLRLTTMALYRYVPGKQELMELMSDRAMGRAPACNSRDWRTCVSQWAHAHLALLQKHRWLIEVVERRTTAGPNWLAWLNAAIEPLARSGLPSRDVIAAVLLVDGHVRSTAQLLTGAPATPQWAENFGRVLQAVHADERFAALNELVRSGEFAPSDDGPIPFEFGLQRVLDGLESWIARQAR